MRIFLTGAKGFTGKQFAKSARTDGHEIIELSSDLSDRDLLRQEIHAAMPDAVVHLAAISFVNHADLDAFYRVNVVGTANLLDALSDLPTLPKRILIASSANVYGNCPHSPISENELPAPINHYAASKLAMEYISATYYDRLPICIVRPFNYTGVGQDIKFVIPKIVDHFVRGESVIELGNLYVAREFNSVETICEIYLKLLIFSDIGEIYNICSGQTYTLQSVMEMMRKISGRDIEIQVNPSFVRSNELNILCGNPQKLRTLFAFNNVEMKWPSLFDTLTNMYTSKV